MTRLMGRFALAALMSGLIAAIGEQAVAGPTIDVTASSNGATNSLFGTLDLSTGQFSQLSALSVTVEGLTTGANGTLYAGASDGNLYTISGGVASRYGTASGPLYFGLASAGAAGFYAADASTNFLDRVSSNGNSISTVGGLNPTIGGSGCLAFGTNGTLYFNGLDSLGTSALFAVNTTTGATTEIGSGLGTLANDSLTLVNVGGQLFGIDTVELSGFGPINIYTINTTTGVATATGVTVSGLAAGFTLDTATAVPEPSSLAMCVLAGVIGLAVARRNRKQAA